MNAAPPSVPDSIAPRVAMAVSCDRSPSPNEIDSASAIAADRILCLRTPRGWRKRALFVIKLATAAAIVTWLLHSGRLNLSHFAGIPFSGAVVGLIGFTLASLLLPALRWWWLLRIQQLDTDLWQTTKMTWAGYAAALILPGAASGDLAKSFFILRQQPRARARALSTIVVDRFVGLYSLLLLGAAIAGWSALQGEISTPLRPICVAVCGILASVTLVVGYVMIVPPPRRLLAAVLPPTWFEAWKESCSLYAQAKLALAGCLALSMASSVLTAVSFTAADRAMGGAIDWTSGLLVGPLIVLANCVPLTPGGIGIAEAAASELFSHVGSLQGAEAMLMVRLAIAAASLVGVGAIFCLRGTANSTASTPAASASERA